jgi:molybdopterin converting factor small subunit
MRVEVLFFGATAEIAGMRKIEVSLDQEKEASQIFASILDKYPRLKDNKLLFSINQEYASGDELLKDGDELAIFTAVSGG